MRWSSLALAGLFAAGATSLQAETDFYQELAALPQVEAALRVAAEGAALAAAERALAQTPITPRTRPQRDRLTDLLARQAGASVRGALRTHLASAMSEEQAAALLDLAQTPEGGALVEAAMLAALAMRQDAGRVAEQELRRAEPLLRSIQDAE